MEPQETPEERRALYARGFPPDWPVGQSGLEEAFEERLRGRPGGELRGRQQRVLARARPRRAQGDPHDDRHRLQEAAVVGTRRAARRCRGTRRAQRRDPGARRDRVLGAAAAGLDLQDRDHHGGARGQARQALDRVPGGEPRASSTASSSRTRTASLAAAASADSFAHSCNSVFAPLGVKVGAPDACRGGRALRLERARHASPARCRARCRRRPRSTRRSRSPRPRSASSRRSPRRFRWPPWRRRSRCAASATRPTLEPGQRARAVARDLAARRAHDRLADGRCRGVRHRHRGGNPGRTRGGQDRHRRARGHA